MGCNSELRQYECHVRLTAPCSFTLPLWLIGVSPNKLFVKNDSSIRKEANPAPTHVRPFPSPCALPDVCLVFHARCTTVVSCLCQLPSPCMRIQRVASHWARLMRSNKINQAHSICRARRDGLRATHLVTTHAHCYEDITAFTPAAMLSAPPPFEII